MNAPDADTFASVADSLTGPPHTAVLTTLLPDGQPQSHVIWLEHRSGRLLVNTERHRSKFQNVCRDPRVTLLLIDGTDTHHFLEVRGRVEQTIHGPEARTHADQLSRIYRGRPYDPDAIRSERVLLHIAPLRCVHVRGRTIRTLDTRSRSTATWSPPELE
ncbi:TIGR03618 family F420-dependent PPOX class oxidoreductase [Streptomyces huasconensis]|uniref:TIGR03618 family F420-dependent PPOX class oxidoreductase n=1 Tax=Streptomyces huasconensis TaxID=1854574 RepID=UPI0033E3B2C7